MKLWVLEIRPRFFLNVKGALSQHKQTKRVITALYLTVAGMKAIADSLVKLNVTEVCKTHTLLLHLKTI